MRITDRGFRGLPTVLVVGVVLALYVTPLLMIVYGAFRSAAPAQPGHLTFEGFVQAFSSQQNLITLGNSFRLALAVAVIATTLAATLCWVKTRTRAFARHFVTPLMAMALALPPLFFALSWSLLGTPRFGLANQWLGMVGLPDTMVSVRGFAGSAFVLGLKVASLCYFMLLGPFSAMDRRLEEASLLAGASRVQTYIKVNLPVMMPALTGAFIVAFIIGLVALDVPLLLGRPVGFRVLSTEIYRFLITETPPNYAAANALALTFIVTVLVLVAVRWRLLEGRSFTTVSGKAGSSDPWDLGRVATGACNVLVLGYALVAVILPSMQVGLGSMQPLFGVSTNLSLENYRILLGDGQIRSALYNTFVLSIFGGALAVAISVSLAIISRHASRSVRRIIDMSTWLPWAVQGVVLGLGLVWAFLTFPFLRPMFGTIWIVLIGFIVAVTPLASRTVDAAIAQIGVELEEAARISGASAVRAALGVVVRLITPAIFAAWVIVAIRIAGNLEVPILLSNPRNPVVATTVFQLNAIGNSAQAAALFVIVLAPAFVLAALVAALRLLVRRWRSPSQPVTATPVGASERALGAVDVKPHSQTTTVGEDHG